ncbi:MAG: response regulator transcription factor [Candidatus Obscuribacterales bacterium]|jgi:DNA-binding NarL/FixJ family response regulator|nr:response regulator transcription factor [Cyanobacteria bacterium SZAS LIN-5]RTL38859.1 MAG: response regulator transcription factor [Candidatus Melainabacteria bacterium]
MRLLVVDDHIPTRQEIVRELSTGGVIEIVGEAETSDQALKVAKDLLPDVVLLDLHLPGLIGTIDLIKRLTALRNVRVVMFASQGKPSDVQDLLDAGAVGYVLKTDPPALIRMALLMVMRGSKGVVSPSLPRHITRLSQDERNVLRSITMRGKLGKAAERLGISEAELMEVVEGLMAKLELEKPEQLVKWAKKQGF